MDSTTRSYFENLHAENKDLQYEAYNQIMMPLDEAIKEISLDLITKEEDPKYKKKYAAVWKSV